MGIKRHFTNGGRYISDKQRREDYIQRRDTKAKYDVALEDKPMPVIDIGIEEINKIIKSITGDNEDAFQEAWVKVLTEHPQNENDIKKYARQSLKQDKDFSFKFNEISMETKVIPENPEESPVLGVSLPANVPELEIHEKERYVATSSGKINRQGYVHLDYDVYMEIKKMFPHDPLNHAIRKILQLPPAERDRKGWHKWEDELIKTRYSWGGVRACQMDLNRSQNAIIKRAAFLGVNAGKSLNGYKPVANWLNIPEFAQKLNISWQVANRIIERDEIDVIRVPDYHQGHTGIFITPQALENYKNGNASRFTRKLTDALKTKPRIMNNTKNIIKSELKVVKKNKKNHYAFLDRNQNVVTLCRTNEILITSEMMKKYDYNPFLNTTPTCKKCLLIKETNDIS